jgi:hypothetical protein
MHTDQSTLPNGDMRTAYGSGPPPREPKPRPADLAHAPAPFGQSRSFDQASSLRADANAAGEGRRAHATGVEQPAEAETLPAVVELSVRRGRVLRFGLVEWAMLLRLAHDFGWLPEGATATDAAGLSVADDRWYGLRPRESVAYRSITANDAVALARALARAAAAVARESDAALLAAAGGVERWSASGPTRSSALRYFVEQGVATYWLDQVSGDLHDAATLVVHGEPSKQDRDMLAGMFPTPRNDPWPNAGAKLHISDRLADADESSPDAADGHPTADDVLARLDADPEFRAALEQEVARAREDDDDPLARHFRSNH